MKLENVFADNYKYEKVSYLPFSMFISSNSIALNPHGISWHNIGLVQYYLDYQLIICTQMP